MKRLQPLSQKSIAPYLPFDLKTYSPNTVKGPQMEKFHKSAHTGKPDIHYSLTLSQSPPGNPSNEAKGANGNAETQRKQRRRERQGKTTDYTD